MNGGVWRGTPKEFDPARGEVDSDWRSRKRDCGVRS